MYDTTLITEVKLSAGAHSSPEEGMCAMEMVAWLEGLPHSDRPECTCPVLGVFARRINDAMPDDKRDALLKPLLPRLVGTVSVEHQKARAEVLAWFAIKGCAVPSLRNAGLNELADKLMACTTIADTRWVIRDAHVPCRSADCAASAAADAGYAAADPGRAAYAADAAAAAAEWAVGVQNVWEKAITALTLAIEAGPQGDFSTNVSERHQALRELVAV